MKIKLATALLWIYSILIPVKASDTPTKEEREFCDRLYKLVAQGELDSVKKMVENPEFDLSAYENNNHYYIPLLHGAAWSENKEMVEYLMEKGANPAALTHSNDSPLHRAAWKGNLEIVKLLVENGADLNVIYNANGGLSPLCCAAESGNIEVVQYLIDKGADVQYTNKDSGASPLRSAAYSAAYDIFLLLAEKQSAEYDWQEALMYGIIGGSPEIVQYIVEKKGAKVNVKSKIRDVFPIQEAAHNKYRSGKNARHLDVIKYLISKGARLTDINHGFIFPWAMDNSNEETIEYFLQQGVKVDMPVSTDGWTPLATALDNGNYVIARHLIKNTKDHTFRNQPLILSFADGLYNSPAIIDLLIKEGVNKEYYTQAFKKCVAANDSLSARLLLDAGADISSLNEDGSNILHLARSYSLATFLIKAGADITNKVMLEDAWKNPSLLQALEEKDVYPPVSKEDMGFALMTAAEHGDIRTVEYMLKRGADVNFSPAPPTLVGEKEIPYSNYISQSEEEEIEQERNQEIYGGNTAAYRQTALIKNAIKGYAYCGYGDLDENNKPQVPARITEVLLAAGADPDIPDSKGRTALHYAAGYQVCMEMPGPIPIGSRRDRELGVHGDPAMPLPSFHDSITKVLIKNGADINAQDHNGDTPIILAAKGRNHGSMQVLLNAGAEVHITNHNRRNIFSYVDDLPAFEIIKEAGMLEKISQEKRNTAFRNFFVGRNIHKTYDPEELRALISYGPDLNTKIYTGYNNNALMYVFKNMYGNKKVQIAQVLVDGGIDLNAEDKDGCTVLMNLIQTGDYKERYREDNKLIYLNFFVKNNADLNYKSSRQYTALGIAICEEEEEAVEFLTAHGAKRDLTSEWWYLITQKYYDKEIIPKLQQLVTKGVDINIKSPVSISKYIPDVKQEGVTALMLFCGYGKEEVIKALLAMGADVNKKAADGTTALSIAKNRRKQNIIDMLLQAGAKE